MIVANFRQTRPTSDKKICFSFHTSHGQRNMQTLLSDDRPSAYSKPKTCEAQVIKRLKRCIYQN